MSHALGGRSARSRTRILAAAVDDPQIELDRCAQGVRRTSVAVEGADLTVADGELFAILGPSGSGKTTVLRMIAGFEQPTAGVIKLGGVDVTAAARAPPRRQHRLPGVRPVPAHDGGAERRVRAEGHAACPRPSAGAAPPTALDMVRLTGQAPRRARATVGRPASARRAGPRAWSDGRGCCCSTSRSAHSTSSCASRCRSNSRRSSARSASRS